MYASLLFIYEYIFIKKIKNLNLFSQEYTYFEPRLVAVSKLKPPELIVAAYEAGQRHFGENYVNELKEKAYDTSIIDKCKDIRWHFIGHLQKNKVNKIISLPNLYIIESVDNKQLATAIDNAFSKVNKNNSQLKIMVQVNTSEEEGTIKYFMLYSSYSIIITKSKNNFHFIFSIYYSNN